MDGWRGEGGGLSTTKSYRKASFPQFFLVTTSSSNDNRVLLMDVGVADNVCCSCDCMQQGKPEPG